MKMYLVTIGIFTGLTRANGSRAFCIIGALALTALQKFLTALYLIGFTLAAFTFIRWFSRKLFM